MTEEFKLKDKRILDKEVPRVYYPEEDVKEFISILKKYDKNKLFRSDFIVISKKDLDKLSGFEAMKNLKKCEASENGVGCGRKAKYLIKDIVCEDKIPFPVCSRCLKFFISKKDKEPHYKIVRRLE